MKLTPLLFALMLAAKAEAQEHPLWMRYPAISPDGSTILFSYKGEIYTVSSKGGTAVPLTISESYEFSPVWSHDGRRMDYSRRGGPRRPGK